ncbi:hypothetical protein ACFLXQ_04970 [Chloroflexota bacterium]
MILIFTLAYRLDDAVFTAADSAGHLLAFFLPGVRLHLDEMTGLLMPIMSIFS